MTRKNAFLIHLGLSALVVGTVIVLVTIFWYPAPWMEVIGAKNVLRILITVDLIVGPCLTLMLYKPGKPGLIFDMCMIALVQIAALVYGVHTVFQERPYYVIFVKDRFEVLAYRDINAQDIKAAELQSKQWRQPIMAVAQMPTDEAERNRLIEETVFQGKPDIHARPEYWSPYTENIAEVMAGSRPIDDLLQQRPELKNMLSAAANIADISKEYVFVPVMGRKQVFSLVLEKSTGKPVQIVDIDPWEINDRDNRLASQ